MKRLFTKRQKKMMSILQNNKCKTCGDELQSSFHGDHKIPFSKNGKTILENAQGLCPKCNLVKGSNLV